jgi:non-ribosomal peptide synthetase component F
MVLLSVYFLLVSKLSGNEDIIIGIDAAGRDRSELEGVVGTFVNVLPIRIKAGEYEPFRTFLARIKDTVLAAFEHQDFQFDDMIALLPEGEDRSLVELYFSFANFFQSETEARDIGFSPVETAVENRKPRYGLELAASAEEGGFTLTFLYDTALYDESTIGLFARYYQNILLSVTGDDSIAAQSIELESSFSEAALE